MLKHIIHFISYIPSFLFIGYFSNFRSLTFQGQTNTTSPIMVVSRYTFVSYTCIIARTSFISFDFSEV
ncbi:hypothetical protein Hanom_Chr00s089998g01798491 [Helianthus anomalus]